MSREQDRIFVYTFVGVIAALVAITIFLIVLATFSGDRPEVVEQRQQLNYERAQERLQPVGAVRLTGEPMPEVAGAEQPEAAQASGEPMPPAQVYQTNCASCHSAGVMGAPKVGSESDWGPRLQARGFDGLVENAINGFQAMPARGGNSRLSDEEVREAVRHMLEESGLSAE